MSQLIIQVKAACFSVVFAFVLSLLLVLLTQAITLGNFKTDEKGESDGLDRTEHGEVGFDFSAATESVTVVSTEPRAATEPRGNGRFEVQLTGADAKELMKVWSDLCQPTTGTPDADFLAVYPHVTTIRGTTFRCRGGDPIVIAKNWSRCSRATPVRVSRPPHRSGSTKRGTVRASRTGRPRPGPAPPSLNLTITLLPMKLVVAIIRPEKLEDVQKALAERDVYLMTVTDVRGCGRQRGYTEVYRGTEVRIQLIPKLKLELAVNEAFVEATVEAIVHAAPERGHRHHRRRQDLRPPDGRRGPHPHRRARPEAIGP